MSSHARLYLPNILLGVTLSMMMVGAFPSVGFASVSSPQASRSTNPTMIAFSSNSVSPPIAAFAYDPCVLCVPPGDAVFFQGNWSTDSSGTILNYTWDFGDGGPPMTTSNPLVSHVYGGTREQWLVTLKVVDSNGSTDSISETVLFLVAPQFSFEPNKPLVTEPVVFNATDSISYNSTAPITGYSWNFGDGTTGAGKIVAHEYGAPGFYRTLLTLQTSSGNPQISKTLLVSGMITVGGHSLPYDKSEFFLPFFGLAALVALGTGVLRLRRRSLDQHGKV